MKKSYLVVAILIIMTLLWGAACSKDKEEMPGNNDQVVVERCRVSQSWPRPTAAADGSSIPLPLMMSAARSASMIVGEFRLPLVMVGNIEESTTRRASIP